MARSLFELSPRTRWLGLRLDLYAEIDSTNRVAQDLARAGAPEGTLVLADAQTAGRGRLGRSFFSPSGSVYLSVLLRPRVGAEEAPHYGFVAAVAVAETIGTWIPTAGLEIKWPNDVLLDGRKVSGINLPSQLEGGRVVSLVLGIGVNVNVGEQAFPPELRPIATSLAIAAGGPVDRVGFAEALIEQLERRIDRYRAGGFAEVLDAWQKYFRMRGARVRIGGPGVAREVEGVVEGIDSDGALLLRDGPVLERIVAGDVTVLRREG